jgi:tetratricopeptide (TPR) repeat protein
MLSRTERLLALVDREAVSEKRLRASPANGAAPLLGLLLLLPGSAAAQPDEVDRAVARWFQEGVSAYGRGEYALAAGLFERTLEIKPQDPNLLYNLGNVYYELDARGRAVAYWVRALRIRPRDGDARFNLRLVVEDDPVVGSALPPVPLSSDELAILFMLFWLGGCTALIARQRWRKAYLTFVGGAAITLALLVAVLMMYPRARYAIVAEPSAALRAGPVRQSEVLATPAPGIGYRVQEERGDWLRVSRGSESEGWIDEGQVEVIE